MEEAKREDQIMKPKYFLKGDYYFLYTKYMHFMNKNVFDWIGLSSIITH